MNVIYHVVAAVEDWNSDQNEIGLIYGKNGPMVWGTPDEAITWASNLWRWECVDLYAIVAWEPEHGSKVAGVVGVLPVNSRQSLTYLGLRVQDSLSAAARLVDEWYERESAGQEK